MREELIPKEGGIYLLHLKLKKELHIRIGKLGERIFPEGDYLYIGSAQSGLRGRIARHLRKEKKIFWHIDYLLAEESVEIRDVCWREDRGKGKECGIASVISYLGEPIKGFGSSDCRCESHLYLFKEGESIEGIKEKFSTMELLGGYRPSALI